VNGESSGIDGVPDLNPDVATDGRGIFMTVWESEDRLDGTVGTRINVVFSVSLDRGANWSEPALAALNTVDDIDFDLRPRIAADARNWVVVWQSADDLQGTIREDRDILATTSSDARRWSAPIPVNTTADIDDEPDLEPEIATDTAGTWMVVWTSEHDLGGRIGMDRDVLAASSVDGGRTWTAPVPANTSAFTDEHSDEQADVASNGTGAWIAVWVTTENIEQRLGMDGDAVFALSTNAGANWTAPDVLNTDADVDNEADAEPHIAAALNGPWIGTWSSRETVGGATGGDADVLFSSSTLDVPGAAPPACGGMEPAFLILAVGLVSRRLRPGSPWRKCSAVGSAAGRSSGAGS
jgi:hypothetical protein